MRRQKYLNYSSIMRSASTLYSEDVMIMDTCQILGNISMIWQSLRK